MRSNNNYFARNTRLGMASIRMSIIRLCVVVASLCLSGHAVSSTDLSHCTQADQCAAVLCKVQAEVSYLHGLLTQKLNRREISNADANAYKQAYDARALMNAIRQEGRAGGNCESLYMDWQAQVADAQKKYPLE